MSKRISRAHLYDLSTTTRELASPDYELNDAKRTKLYGFLNNYMDMINEYVAEHKGFKIPMAAEMRVTMKGDVLKQHQLPKMPINSEPSTMSLTAEIDRQVLLIDLTSDDDDEEPTQLLPFIEDISDSDFEDDFSVSEEDRRDIESVLASDIASTRSDHSSDSDFEEEDGEEEIKDKITRNLN